MLTENRRMLALYVNRRRARYEFEYELFDTNVFMLWAKQFYHYEIDKWLEERGSDPFKPMRKAERCFNTTATAETHSKSNVRLVWAGR